MKEKVYNAIPGNKYVTNKEIAKLSGVNVNTVRRILPELHREGLIEYTWA
jgi:transcription initiation factor IIE alpha subunit